MQNVILIKLGGSIITDKTQSAVLRADVLKRLAGEIAEAHKQLPQTSLVVGNGAGSFGHVPAKQYETQKGLIHANSKEGVARVRLAVSQLNQFVVEALIEAGEQAISFQTSAVLTTNSGEVATADFTQATHFLRHGFTLVPYGDVVYDSAQGVSIMSTERILNAMLTEWLKTQPFHVSMVIMVSDVDGVYKNLKTRGEIFPEITQTTFPDVGAVLGKASGADVTGGMLHKLETALAFAAAGTPTLIINGFEPNRLHDAILGKPVTGTTIL